MLLLPLLLLFRETSEVNPILRKTTVCNQFMFGAILYHRTNANGVLSNSWFTLPYNIQPTKARSNHLKLHFFPSMNNVPIGATSTELKTQSKLLAIDDASVTISFFFSDYSAYSPSLIFSSMLSFFWLPPDVPFFSEQQISFSNFSQTQNLQTPSLFTFQQDFPIDSSLKQTCFYDNSRTIKDKIHVMANLRWVILNDADYVNLTSPSNWIYDWESNNTTIPIGLSLVVHKQQPQPFLVVANILYLCPNSYKYVVYNYSMGASSANWFSLEPTYYTKYKTAFIDYPFSNNQSANMILQITGMSLFASNFSNITATAGTSVMFVSWDISQAHSPDCSPTGYLANISYYVVSPASIYVNYGLFGLIGDCPTNLVQYNATHCACPKGSFFSQTSLKCLSCTFFNPFCTDCNISENCTSCGFNFIKNLTGCVCPTLSYAVSNALCYLCKELYPYCVECSNVSCSKCQVNFQMQNNTCVCNGDRYLTLGRNCQLCASIHPNCVSCNNRGSCLKCKQNFTLVDGRCLCSYPRLTNPNDSNSCLLCEDVKGSLAACQLSVRGQFYQSGKVLYFWLRYSRPLDQISFVLPIQYNVKVSIAGVNTPFTYDPQTGVFAVSLSKVVGSSTAEVGILEKECILSDGVQLSNDPLPFAVSEVGSEPVFSRVIETMFQAKNYAILAITFLSLGVYSKLFKALTIIGVVCLSRQNLPNSVGLISKALNLSTPFDPLNLNIKLPFKRIPCQELRMVVYGLNKPIITLSLQLYAAGLLSICLITYIRGYLITKKHANKHRVFRNILKHSKEYLLQNVLNLQMLLVFPALLQIRLICSLGVKGITENVANFTFVVCLLSIQTLFISLYVIVYHFDRYNYSVLFNQLRPSTLTFVYWVVTTLQPYAISIFALFMSQSINLYLIIAANSLSLLLLLLCLPFCCSKIGYFIDLGKAVCVLYVSVALLFNHADSLILKIGAYSIVGVCALQFLQIVFKSGEMVLRNKGLIPEFTKISDDVEIKLLEKSKNGNSKQKSEKNINQNLLIKQNVQQKRSIINLQNAYQNGKRMQNQSAYQKSVFQYNRRTQNEDELKIKSKLELASKKQRSKGQ